MRTAAARLWALVVLVLTVVAGVVPAARADEPARVSVSITSSSAPLLDLSRDDQVVEFSGTLVNTSGLPIRWMSVQFWRDTTPLRDQTELREAAARPSMAERGRLVSQERGNVEIITQDDPLEVGERRTFTVRATVKELGLRTDDAVYRVGVHVRGVPDGRALETVGRAQVLATATRQKLTASALVELSAAPSRTGPTTFVGDSLIQDLTERLEPLLRVAEKPGVQVLLDPLLADDLRALARPHFIDGENLPARPEAADFLSRLERLVQQGRVWRLPWGNPSTARASADDVSSALTWGQSQVSGTPEEDLPLALVVGAEASTELLDRLASGGVNRVVASTVQPGRRGPLTVIHTASLSEPGPGPQGRHSKAQLTGRRVAEDFLSASPRAYLARDTETVAQLDDALASYRLVPPTATGSAALTTPPEAPVPWPRLAERLDEAEHDVAFQRELTGVDRGDELTALQSLALSAGFPDEERALAWVEAQPVSERVEDDPVTIRAARQFIMGSRTNTFPVTVTNRLDVPVRVRLRFDSDAPERIRVPTTDLVTVGPGENLTVNVTPEAASSGGVRVVARLETKGGTTFGPETPIQIAATDVGRVGWIIVVVSGAVVLGGTALRIRAVQAEKAGKVKNNHSA